MHEFLSFQRLQKIYEISPIAESFSNLPDVVPDPAIPPRNHETSHMHDFYGDHHNDYSEFRPKIASTRNRLVNLIFYLNRFCKNLQNLFKILDIRKNGAFNQ